MSKNLYNSDGKRVSVESLHEYLPDSVGLIALPKVTRVEVIDENGRSYVKYFKKGKLCLSFQDDIQTLKLFI
jgi:hypothetical protein